MTLEEFLRMDLKEERVSVEIPRIHLTFVLKPLMASEVSSIEREVSMEFKRMYPNVPLDDTKYYQLLGERLLLASIVEPDMLDPRLMAKANATYPYEILGNILRQGELLKIQEVYQKLNDGTYLNEKLIEEAKN